MSIWSSIGGAVCVALTAVGLVMSWRIWRKSGATRGLRAVAWSLIPLGAYLTNSIHLIGRIGSAIVQFASAFVFSPKTWAGVVVLGVAALLFLSSGGLPLMNWRKSRERRKAAADAGQPKDSGKTSSQPAVVRAKSKTSVPAGSDDEDMSDVQDILNRRGIK
jgi:hypothetical protein